MAPRSSESELERYRPGDAEPVAAQHARSAGAVWETEAIADFCGRLEAGFRGSDLAGEVLEPVASFIGAETASLRFTPSSRGRAIPRAIATVGISATVGEAYRERFHALDPARRLPRHGATGPVFADPNRPGQWLGVHVSPARTRRLQADFREYRRAFLAPNDLVQHVGFYLSDEMGRTFLFDFHRGRRAAPFGRLEIAKARVAARYLHARMTAASWQPALSRSTSAALDDALSAREREVAVLVTRGLANKEVACTLEISARTVENHLRAIFAKLGVASRMQLAAVLHRYESGNG